MFVLKYAFTFVVSIKSKVYSTLTVLSKASTSTIPDILPFSTRLFTLSITFVIFETSLISSAFSGGRICGISEIKSVPILALIFVPSKFNSSSLTSSRL